MWSTNLFLGTKKHFVGNKVKQFQKHRFMFLVGIHSYITAQFIFYQYVHGPKQVQSLALSVSRSLSQTHHRWFAVHSHRRSSTVVHPRSSTVAHHYTATTARIASLQHWGFSLPLFYLSYFFVSLSLFPHFTIALGFFFFFGVGFWFMWNQWTNDWNVFL